MVWLCQSEGFLGTRRALWDRCLGDRVDGVRLLFVMKWCFYDWSESRGIGSMFYSDSVFSYRYSYFLSEGTLCFYSAIFQSKHLTPHPFSILVIYQTLLSWVTSNQVNSRTTGPVGCMFLLDQKDVSFYWTSRMYVSIGPVGCKLSFYWTTEI